MSACAIILTAVLAAGVGSDETVVRIDAGRVIQKISPLLYGACIEDVNHEIYGGLYSQLIFGESFQEPARPLPIKGFRSYGGRWQPVGGELVAEAGDGPKLVSDKPSEAGSEVGVDVFFPTEQNGNAGLIVKVNQPKEGADEFTGYEVSLETSGHLALVRHRRNWEPIRRVACDVPIGRWIAIVVRMKKSSIEILVDGKSLVTYDDVEHPLAAGLVGLRTWQRPARFRSLWVKTGDSVRKLAFEVESASTFGEGVSGMWRALRSGSAQGEFAIETRAPFVGRQSQRITFGKGQGEIGIENQGLNRWGLNFVEGKPYECSLWARSDRPTRVVAALESRDGMGVFADATIEVNGNEWKRYDVILTPKAADRAGRFAIRLAAPGSIEVGHAFLQPGDWGRFKGLPDRLDVANALIDQRLSVLRYGGSMINHPEYRWKKMIGPRDRRQPSAGRWYRYSSNGWGIFDFLNFCEAAGLLGIPAVNMGETAKDMADFVEYANGPVNSEWGRKRVADGHPEPYRLKHVELGNEEALNQDYWKKFEPIAEAMWAKDPQIILIVGDFAYHRVIEDPYHFQGGAAANSLAVHKQILELARARNREIWFDIHISTDHPPEPKGLLPERSYIDQLGKIAPGANYKVVIFEFNSGNHAMRRALSNAWAINEVERIGALLPIACAANCLQPDGQNDNGWDQGLLFLNPSQVWLQPPGYVTQMAAEFAVPLLLDSKIEGPADGLSLNAKRSQDGKTLVLQVVNTSEKPRAIRIEVIGFVPSKPLAAVQELSGPLDGVNTAEAPNRFKPRQIEWPHATNLGKSSYTFAPHSFTIMRLE